MIGLETALGLGITELVKNNTLSWNELVNKMSTAPAAVAGLTSKGSIKEGMDADLVLIDPKKE